MTPPPAALAIAAPQSAERSVEHPLEASDRLAWQATAAVGLLDERRAEPAENRTTIRGAEV